MTRNDMARRIREQSLLRGEFALRSGAVSSVYWDKYRFESDPTLLTAIGDAMRALLPSNFDKLAGLELGGVPLATALSLATSKPSLYVRKAAKTYGTCNLVEGGYRAGEVVVVIEDVITSGGQVVTSVEHMRGLGLVVHEVVCVIDREQGGRAALARIDCGMKSVFTMAELEIPTDDTSSPSRGTSS